MDWKWTEEEPSTVFYSHFKTLLWKRMIYGSRDIKMLMCQIIIPVLLVILGLSILLIQPSLSQPDLVLSSANYNPALPLADRNFVPMLVTPTSQGGSDSSILANQIMSKFTASNPAIGGVAVPVDSAQYDILPASSSESIFGGCSQGAQPLYNMSTFLLLTKNGFPTHPGTTNGTQGQHSIESRYLRSSGLPVDGDVERRTTATATATATATVASNGTSNGGVNGTDEKGATRYGAVTIDGASDEKHISYNVMVNGSAVHGVGVYVNELHQALLQVVTGQTKAKITARNHPLPRTYKQDNEKKAVAAFVASLFFMIAFNFIPASFATFVVRERETKATHQQIISGVSIWAYWWSTYVFDTLSYLLTVALVEMALWAYQVDVFTHGHSGLTALTLFLLFGPSVAAFTYICSHLFSSHSTAQIVVMFMNFVTGLGLVITAFVLSGIELTRTQSVWLRKLFRVFPSYCLGDGLLHLSMCYDDPSFKGTFHSPKMLDVAVYIHV
jgi:hypothetical protein